MMQNIEIGKRYLKLKYEESIKVYEKGELIQGYKKKNV